MAKDEDEYREELTEEEYEVLRERGTEPRFSSDLLDMDEEGSFHCRACGRELFTSEQKFEGDHGWPSFSDVVDDDAIELRKDTRHGMERIEVVCAECGSHLGHVFDDGPDPTGKRYCINGVALEFEPEE